MGGYDSTALEFVFKWEIYLERGRKGEQLARNAFLTILQQRRFFSLGWWTGAFWTGAIKPLFIGYSKGRCFSERLRTNGWFGCFFYSSYSDDLVISAIMTPIFHGHFRLDFYFVNTGFYKLCVYEYILRQTQ